ncbi:MAG: autotransporter-associated beta strand repeat-containing protein, partial [Burkholderiales bacterium]|nr:autotransporter-associated beta strand repeat-containing protein [Opitutaceae bacterium]
MIRPLRACLLLIGALSAARAADYYFDVNSSAPGSGVAANASYSATTAVWSTTSDGTATPVANPGRQGYVFSAGTDAFDRAFTVTGFFGQVSQGITVEEGQVTLSGGGTFFAGTTVRTRAGTSLTFATTSWDFYNNTVTFEPAADAPITLNSVSTTSGRGGHLAKTGHGRLTVTGNATANGFSTVVHQGELRLQAANALYSTAYPTKSYPVTVNSGGTLALAGDLTFANNPATLAGPGHESLGTLRAVSGNASWNALLTLASATRITADSGASLTLNPPATDAVTGPFALTFGGAGDITVSRPISALTALLKDGPGLLTLAAANLFTGPTTVSAGTLRFVESSGILATVGGPLSVTAPASVEIVNASARSWPSPLSGSGRFVKLGAGRLTLPGPHAFAGTFAIQSGTFALAADTALDSAVRFEISAAATLDLSAAPSFTLVANQSLSGAGSIVGPLASASGAILDLTPGASLSITGNVTLANGTVIRTPAALANGTYPILRAVGGTISATPASLVVSGFSSATQLASLTVSATELSLVVSENPYAGRALVWAGDGTTNLWDPGLSANWRAASALAVFNPPDSVTFDATGATNPVVTLVGSLLPASVTVSSSADYTFTGSGSIAGSATLAKSGTGRLVLTSPHAFTGGTTLTGGTLELRASSALGSGPVANSATLALAPASSLTFTNPLSGPGSLVVSSGTATVSAANTFSGPAAITSGTLVLGHVNALGATSAGTSVSSAATLDLAGLSPAAEPITLSGGTLRNSAPAATTFSGPLALAAPSAVSAVGNLTLSGPLSGDAPLTLVSGLVRLTGDSRLAATPFVVAPSATLGGDGFLGGSLAVSGTLAPSAGTSGVSTLNVTGPATLLPGSTTTFRIQKSNNTAASDRLAVTNLLTLGGSFSVTLSGQPLAAGDTFAVFSAAAFSGTFDSVSLPYLSGDLIWDRSDLATSGVLRVIALPAVSSIPQRRDWLLTRLADDPGGVDGFTAAGGFFARGDLTTGRAYALSRSRSLLANHLNGAVQVDLFYIWPAVDLVARHGPLLDDETKANIRQIVLTFYQYKDTTTSNLKTLGHVVRFLGGELYGQAAFDAAKVPASNLTNDWRSSDPAARASLLSLMDTFVTTGCGEVASRPYVWKNLLPLLSLAQLAQDPVVRQRAALAYEASLAQHAGYWLRGHLAMPTTRSYPDMLEQHPTSGASMGMFWYHFGGELPALDSDSALLTAVMNPSVSPILELAASSRDTPFISRSRNGPNYLQAYLERDYALFADGPVGPNSGQVYANGVVWTDSSRSRYSHLWVAKPIHDDPSSINVSNTHGKESRQFAETVARDALLYSFDIAPPADLTITPTPTPYGMGYVPGGYRAVVNDAATTGQIFLHYGSVLIAIRSELPFGWNPATTITYPSGTVRAGDSEFLIDGDTATTRPPATFTTPLTANLRFAVAIETARPADFPGATPADQLAAFRTAILAIPKPSRPADAPTTAVYTTRRGDRLRLTRSQDIATYPVTVNDAPVEHALFPRIENPWIYQPAGSKTLVLRSPDRRETLDLATWTRTTVIGPTDVTAPVFTKVPANLTISPTHPQPVVTYNASALDAIDGPVPVTFFPPSGSVFTPGTTTVVTATAADSSLNTTTATFTVTVLPYPNPPPPAAPFTVQNIGAQPVVPGTARHDVANRVILVTGTGGTSGTGASGDIWSGS